MAVQNRAQLCEALYSQMRKLRDSLLESSKLTDVERSNQKRTLQINYETICSHLIDASKEYYAGESTGIDDYRFDLYVTLLRELETKGLVTTNPNSPAAKVNGGNPGDTVEHIIPMLSLGDLFSHEQLSAWYPSQVDVSFSVEPKIDGLSVELWYTGGKLVRGVTRGNGLKGEDVTDKCLKIKTIPNTIKYLDGLVVRGEIYMSYERFRVYKAVDGSAKNERNTAVGLLKRKDGGEAAGQYLDCFVFNIQGGGTSQTTHIGSLTWLAELGFHVIPHKYATDLPSILAEVDRIQSIRNQLPFRIDGAVIKGNNLTLRERLGDNGSIPRWAVAYKYPAVQANTIVKDIIFQLGKTGKITPVAILDPVNVDGSTISRCTLHNKNRMLELAVCVGDRVYLHKAGDIIPKITAAEHTEQSKPFYFPDTCPVCGSKLFGDTCKNLECKSKVEAKLYLWADKGGLDIKGVSGSLVSQLIERGLIKTPADYYKLTPADLYRLPKMGPTKVRNVLTAINETKKKSFPEVLVAMGIDGLGWSAASKLNSHAHSWDDLARLSSSDCIAYTGVSVGGNLYKALQTEYYQNLIVELKKVFKFE